MTSTSRVLHTNQTPNTNTLFSLEGLPLAIPNSVIQNIFSFLPESSLAEAAKVNTTWRRLITTITSPTAQSEDVKVVINFIINNLNPSTCHRAITQFRIFLEDRGVLMSRTPEQLRNNLERMKVSLIRELQGLRTPYLVDIENSLKPMRKPLFFGPLAGLARIERRELQLNRQRAVRAPTSVHSLNEIITDLLKLGSTPEIISKALVFSDQLSTDQREKDAYRVKIIISILKGDNTPETISRVLQIAARISSNSSKTIALREIVRGILKMGNTPEIISEALRMAHSMEGGSEKGYALINIVEVVLKTGNTPEIISEALKIKLSIGLECGGTVIAYVTHKIVQTILTRDATKETIDEALSIAQMIIPYAIPGIVDPSSAFRDIAQAVLTTGNTREIISRAFDIAKRSPGYNMHQAIQDIIQAILTKAPTKESVSSALVFTCENLTEHDKDQALVAIVAAGLKTGNTPEILSEALEIAHMISERQIASQAFNEIIKAVLATGNTPATISQALEIANSSPKGFYNDSTYKSIVDAILKMGNPDISQACDITLHRFSHDSEGAFWAITDAVLTKGNTPEIISEALSIVQMIPDTTRHFFPKESIITTTLEKGVSPEIISKLLEIAQSLGPEREGYAFSKIAIAVLKTGNTPEIISEALRISQMITHLDQARYCKTEIIKAILKTGNTPSIISQALAIAERMPEEYTKSDALRSVMQAVLTREITQRTVDEALGIAQRISLSEYDKVGPEAIMDIVRAILKTGNSPTIIASALEIAQHMPEGELKDEMVCEIEDAGRAKH